MSNIDEKMFEKIMRGIIKDGKYDLGLRESMKSLKGVKLLIYSNNIDKTAILKIEESCKKLSVPTIAYPGSSMALGIICGKPFTVSVISIRSTGDIDISALVQTQI